MLSLVVVAAFLFAAVCVVIRHVVAPPSHFPKNIPTVPFYVTLLSLFKDVDQIELYKKYMESGMRKYGAVSVYFGDRWNVLVGNHALLQEVLKDEDIFKKSGNQEKIPYSVLADYLGDNIISAHGKTWAAYSDVMKPGLQRNFDLDPLYETTRKLNKLLDPDMGKAILLGPLLQRHALACLFQSLLGVNFEAISDPLGAFHQSQSLLKQEIFVPLFMSFPILDKIPFPSRTRARARVQHFRTQLATVVRTAHAKVDCTLESDKLGQRLIAARQNGVLTEKQFQDNLLIAFVAGHENPQIAMVSLFYFLGRYTGIQKELRQQIFAQASANEHGCPPDRQALKSCALLASVVYETLRLLPPLSQIVNRLTTKSVVLGDRVTLSPNIYVGYHCYSICQDPAIWGEDAAEFRPSRWGSTPEEVHAKYRHVKSKAWFPTFHGGRRACLGERFALLELQVLIWTVIRSFSWKLDEDWKQGFTPAGPLYPKALKVVFQRLDHGDD